MAANRSWGKIVQEGFDWEKMCEEDAASTTQVPSSTQSTYRSWEKVVQEELDWAAMCAEDAASTTQEVPSSKDEQASTQSADRSWEKIVQEKLDWAAMCAEDAASTTQVPSSKKKQSFTQVPKKKVSKQEKRQAVYELLSENRYAPLLLVNSKI